MNLCKEFFCKKDVMNIINKIMLILFCVSVVFFLRYQLYLLNYIEYGDESETIVAAKMLANGSKLYNEIFNHHGPLTFLSGLVVESFGDFNVSFHRLPIMFLQWGALFSLYFTPIPISKENRKINFLIASSLIVVLLSQIFGHMYIYQTITGLISMIILAQYTLPSVIGIKPKPWISITCSALTVSLPFLAITYLPTALLLVVTSARRNNLKESITGIVAGLSFNLLFILLFSSIKGYLAYHIYLNLRILAPDQTIVQLLKNIVDFFIHTRLGFSTLIYLVIVTLATYKYSKEVQWWRAIFLVLIPMSFCIRNAGWVYYGLPYWYSLVGLLPILFRSTKSATSADEEFNYFKSKEILKKLPLYIFLVVCMIKVMLIYPGDLSKIKSRPIPTETEFSNIVMAITNKDDKILALTFRHYEYIISDRLPASAHYFYLPWQAYYNQKPKFGIYNSLKDDIINNKPKIIMADKWKVWNRDEYAWVNYASDIDKVLESNYYQIKNKPYYIRNDINLADYGLDPETALPLKVLN